MADMIGFGYIHAFGTVAFAQSDLSGYVSPLLDTLRLTHTSAVDRIKAQTGGNTKALIAQDETLECTFEVIPQGTTFANALKAAGVPGALKGFTITGLQIVAMGSWTDALNVTTGGVLGNPWIYLGGATVNGFIDQKWTLSLPLVRFVSIANVTPIV